MITGNTLTGKTVLAMHIQYRALERGETCQFVSFRQPFWRVVLYYESFACWDIREYINEHRLFISDLFSARYFPTKQPIEDRLDELETRGFTGIRAVVYFLDDPDDPERFIQTHVDIFERKGPGGANMIDALSDQLQFATDAENVIRIHERAREVFASPQYQGTGFHLYSPDQIDVSRGLLYSKILDGFEDGKIELRTELAQTGLQRYFLRVAGIRGWCGATRWHEFTITSDRGFELVGPADLAKQDIIGREAAMDELRELKAKAQALRNRLTELDKKDAEGMLDDARTLKLRTTFETQLFQTLSAIARRIPDGDLIRAVESCGERGEDETAIRGKLNSLAERRGWAEVKGLIGRHKGRILDLMTTVTLKVAERYLGSKEE